MTRKMAEAIAHEIIPAEITGNRTRLEEFAGWGGWESPEEEMAFLKSLCWTGLSLWFKKKRTEEDDIILADTLAVLMYVIE